MQLYGQYNMASCGFVLELASRYGLCRTLHHMTMHFNACTIRLVMFNPGCIKATPLYKLYIVHF